MHAYNTLLRYIRSLAESFFKSLLFRQISVSVAPSMYELLNSKPSRRCCFFLNKTGGTESILTFYVIDYKRGKNRERKQNREKYKKTDHY
jgi:hypothetical protein